MKKVAFCGLLVIISLLGFSTVNDDDSVLGKWEWKRPSPKDPLSIVLTFKANGGYDIIANQKPFVAGTYKMQHDTMYISAPICNNKYMGTYKVKFMGRRDSIQFKVVADTCRIRRQGTDGFVYRKVK